MARPKIIENAKTMSIYLEQDFFKLIKIEAEKQNIKISKLVRIMLEREIERMSKGQA